MDGICIKDINIPKLWGIINGQYTDFPQNITRIMEELHGPNREKYRAMEGAINANTGAFKITTEVMQKSGLLGDKTPKDTDYWPEHGFAAILGPPCSAVAEQISNPWYELQIPHMSQTATKPLLTRMEKGKKVLFVYS